MLEDIHSMKRLKMMAVFTLVALMFTLTGCGGNDGIVTDDHTTDSAMLTTPTPTLAPSVTSTPTVSPTDDGGILSTALPESTQNP